MTATQPQQHFFLIWICPGLHFQNVVAEERVMTDVEAREHWDALVRKHNPGPAMYLCSWGVGSLRDGQHRMLEDDGV